MWAVITAFTLSTMLVRDRRLPEAQHRSNSVQVEMFSCLPVSTIFDLDNPTRKCIAWVPFYISQASMDVFMNLILLLFPLPLLGILKIDRKQRCM
jgi:hypothetical protein